jgi:hypothetical protein
MFLTAAGNVAFGTPVPRYRAQPRQPRHLPRRSPAPGHRRGDRLRVRPLRRRPAGGDRYCGLGHATGPPRPPGVGLAELLAERAGRTVVDPAAVPAAKPLTPEVPLTRRDSDVLDELIQGQSNRQIGRNLFISEYRA